MIPKPARALSLFLLCLLLAWAPIVGQTNSPEVSVSGSVSARTIRQDELLQFTLTIKNKADAKTSPHALLQNLALQELPDGYSLDPGKKICVLPLLPPQPESCQTAVDFAAHQRLLTRSLAPGQSLTVQGYLKPDSPHKAASLTAVVAWTAAGSGLSSSQSANLGENQVQKTSQAAWTWFGDLVKLLAIPIVLAFIGYGLNLLNRKHDERLAAAQAQRQAEQHQHEVQQAVRSETWKQMLLVSHKYAAECYLPLSLAAERLADNLTGLSGPKGNQKVTFYYMLLCGKRMAKTRKDTGGFYFKDLRGETVAARCWKNFRDTLLGLDEDAPFYVATFCAFDTISEIETYQAFKRKYEIVGAGVTYNDGDIECAWTLFQQRLQTNAAAIPDVVTSLKGFYAALDYESNRPYKYWYDIRDKMTLTPEVVALFRNILGTDGRFTEQQINDYIAGTDDA